MVHCMNCGGDLPHEKESETIYPPVVFCGESCEMAYEEWEFYMWEHDYYNYE